MRGDDARSVRQGKRQTSLKLSAIGISSQSFFLISKNGSCYFSVIPRRGQRRECEKRERKESVALEDRAGGRREVQQRGERRKTSSVIIVIIRECNSQLPRQAITWTAPIAWILWTIREIRSKRTGNRRTMNLILINLSPHSSPETFNSSDMSDRRESAERAGSVCPLSRTYGGMNCVSASLGSR